MSKSLIKTFILIISAFSYINMMAQPNSGQSLELPMSFIIGEHEESYEKMVKECDTHLLSVCDESMDEAYKNWLLMLDDIETYAEEKSFDINGIKIWMTVYWNYDGSIKHIVYYPKPNSKNMDFENLTEFFSGFSQVYKLPKTSTSCFSHYGSASFPSHSNHAYGN